MVNSLAVPSAFGSLMSKSACESEADVSPDISRAFECLLDDLDEVWVAGGVVC